MYFCSFQVFHKDHLYIDMEKNPMYEKFNMEAKTLFCLPSLLTVHILQ